jgi:hypothetical protein
MRSIEKQMLVAIDKSLSRILNAEEQREVRYVYINKLHFSIWCKIILDINFQNPSNPFTEISVPYYDGAVARIDDNKLRSDIRYKYKK